MKFVINILAILFGWFLGSIINLGLIQLGHKLFPIVGLDLNDMVALAELMPTLEFEFFIFPFLAHALGTLAGATTASTGWPVPASKWQPDSRSDFSRGLLTPRQSQRP